MGFNVEFLPYGSLYFIEPLNILLYFFFCPCLAVMYNEQLQF